LFSSQTQFSSALYTSVGVSVSKKKKKCIDKNKNPPKMFNTKAVMLAGHMQLLLYLIVT
jgi:hypothetical protein